MRARREAAERRAAQIATAKAARRERRRVKAARGAEPATGAQRPYHRALFAAVIAAILLIGLLSAVLAVHYGSQRPTGGTSALSAKTNQASGGTHQPRSQGQSHRQAAQHLGAGCRAGNPLANVYHEDRLEVRNRCMAVTGTVAYVAHEDDGDIHVDLSLPPSETHLLNEANVADQYGQLVTEIVPADEPGCTPGKPPRPAHGSYN